MNFKVSPPMLSHFLNLEQPTHHKRRLLEDIYDPLTITILAISGCLILIFLGTIIYTVRKCIELQNRDKVIIIDGTTFYTKDQLKYPTHGLEPKYQEYTYKNNQVRQLQGNAASQSSIGLRPIQLTNEIGQQINVGPSQKPNLGDDFGGQQMMRNQESRSDNKSLNGFYQTNTIGRGSLNMKSRSDLISMGSQQNNSRNIRKGPLSIMDRNSFRVNTLQKPPPRLGHNREESNTPMFGIEANNLTSTEHLNSEIQTFNYGPPPSVPRAGKTNKNIFSPKNLPDKVNGAVVSPARNSNRRIRPQRVSSQADEVEGHHTAMGNETGSHVSNPHSRNPSLQMQNKNFIARMNSQTDDAVSQQNSPNQGLSIVKRTRFLQQPQQYNGEASQLTASPITSQVDMKLPPIHRIGITEEGMNTNRYYKKDRIKMARNIARGEMELEMDIDEGSNFAPTVSQHQEMRILSNQKGSTNDKYQNNEQEDFY